MKAYELAAACEYLGLEPQKPDEDPFNSKRIYVRARLQNKTLSALVDIAQGVITEYGDDDLRALVGALGARGGEGSEEPHLRLRWPKPQIVLPDSINNTIRIVKNAQYCLVYDQPLEDRGLSWSDLAAWWVRQHPEHADDATRHVSHCGSGCVARDLHHVPGVRQTAEQAPAA
ncbi:hypothetical protein ACF090_33930 [Streptomyces sp. NPDC014892]|uniref:hypothetical protein n=1 Tax=Streptomyces sp. NPDC014892 TaxID=3364930 RepID=UPI0036F59335